MLDQFKKLIGHSAIYGLSVAGSTIGLMILTPLFLHRLSRAEYGVNEVLNVTASMLYTFLLLGIGSVYIKYYVNDCKDEEERHVMFSSMFYAAVGVSVVLFLLSCAISESVSVALFKSPKYAYLVRLSMIAGGSQLALIMVNTCLRSKQWALKFVMVSLTQFLAVVLLNVYLVGMRNQGVFGVQLSSVICYLIAVSVGLFLLRSDLVWRFSSRVLRNVLLISLPVFPATLAPWVLNVSDRYFLSHYCGLADTGLYAAGYKVGMVGMFVFITATQYAWPPVFFASSDSQDTRRLCANYSKHYLLLLAVAALGFSLFAPEIIRLIASREYWPAHWIVPYIAASYVFYGFQFFTIPFFIKTNKGKQLSYIMGGCAIGKLLLNVILIPLYGLSGAVISVVIIFGIEVILSMLLANKFYPIAYPYANLAKILVLSAVVYVVFRGMEATSALSLVLKLAAFPVLAILLFITRFFSQSEMALMGKALRRVLPS